MELRSLLKDDVFVDFFNTFLSLPVFGQTPLLLISENKWLMCPNLPLPQVNTGAFLKWLETRLVFFKQTELYHNFIFCKEILTLMSSHSTEELKYSLADQWLVRRCLAGVRGIQRFRSFLKGTAGEELMLFCVRVSVYLSMKEEDEFQALLKSIRLTHLSGSSAVLSLCCTHTDVMSVLLSNECPVIGRKTMLAEMRSKALCKLQSYWLPQFLHCCKSWVWRVPECHVIVEGYMSLSSHCSPVRSPSPCDPDLSNHKPTYSPAKSYCSRETKQCVWSLHHQTTDCSQHMDSHSFCLWLPLHRKQDAERFQCSNNNPNNHASIQTCLHSSEQVEKQEREAVDHHTCVQTPVCKCLCCVNIQPPDHHCYVHLHPALSADGFAGGPFRTFLKANGLTAKLQMLNLYQELELVLQLVLRVQGEDLIHAQSQIVVQRIKERCFRELCHESLDPNSLHHLSSLLPSTAAVPWIYKAKYEISKELQDVYDSFLEEEDKVLLSHLSLRSETDEDSEQLLFCSFESETEALLTQMEGLRLSERCSSHYNADALSQESWVLMVQQDLQKGGSLLLNDTRIDSPDKLILRNPAEDKQTQSDRMTLAQGVPASKSLASAILQKKAFKKDINVLQKPSSEPRSFEDVFTTPQTTDHFKHFLQSHNADGALLFIQEADALRSTEPEHQKAKIHAIVDKFFRREDPMDVLQCDADIINTVQQMNVVSADVIFTIQHLVLKSLEATWFKQYQDTFSSSMSDSCIRGVQLKEKLMKKNVWEVFSFFIRRVMRFLSAVKDPRIRREFVEYLRRDHEDFSEPYVVSCTAQRTSDSPDGGEMFEMKRRIIINKTIIVNFLTNDFSFYLECERFRCLADAGVVMASDGMYRESDYHMLHSKAEMIIKLFLQSDISPELRINITEAQRDVIVQRFVCGKVDRRLFYPAMMDVFPVLVSCWRKFCCVKVMKRGDEGLTIPRVVSSPEVRYPINVLHDQKVKTVSSIRVKEPTLHFSTYDSFILMLPETRLNHSAVPTLQPPNECS